jgi:uncharacterized protein (DUF433 family)
VLEEDEGVMRGVHVAWRAWRTVVEDESRLNMGPLSRITIDPQVCHGRPTIRGLRYTVEMILDLLSSGMTSLEILNDYEDLEEEDILAALGYAARLTRVKRIEPVAA